MKNEPAVCIKCQEDKAKSAATPHQATSCEDQYAAVERCMAAHKGNISDCRTEWTAFRQCHNATKK